MSGESTTVYLLTPEGERVLAFGGGQGAGESDFVSLSYASTVNAAGAAILNLRSGQIPAAYRVGPDWQLEITRSVDPATPERLEGQTRWFVRKLTRQVSAGALTLGAASALCLLDTRDVAYAAGSSQASKSGASDDLIKAIARENLGSSATDTARRLRSDLFAVAADVGLGPSAAKAFSRKNVLQVVQEICAAAAQQGVALFVDVVWNGACLELQTFLGQRGADRSLASPAPLTLEADSLGDINIEEDYTDEATAVYAAGQGLESDRDIQLATSDGQIARSPWARREVTLGATQVAKDNAAALLAEARRGLWERRARTRFSATITPTPQLRYGIEWDWGDRATASVAGQVWPVRIDTRQVTIAGGLETITAALRVEQ